MRINQAAEDSKEKAKSGESEEAGRCVEAAKEAEGRVKGCLEAGGCVSTTDNHQSKSQQPLGGQMQQLVNKSGEGEGSSPSRGQQRGDGGHSRGRSSRQAREDAKVAGEDRDSSGRVGRRRVGFGASSCFQWALEALGEGLESRGDRSEAHPHEGPETRRSRLETRGLEPLRMGPEDHAERVEAHKDGLEGPRDSAHRKRLEKREEGMENRGEDVAARWEGAAARGEGLAPRGEGLAARGEGHASRGEGLAPCGEGLVTPGEGLVTQGQGIKTRREGLTQLSEKMPATPDSGYSTGLSTPG